MSGIPSIEETRAVILSKHDEKWLKAQLKKINAEYQDSLDEKLAHWMIANRAGLEVSAIKADAGGVGQALALIEATEQFAAEQADLPDEKQGFFEVRGVVLNMEEGLTRKQKPVLDFVLADETGSARFVVYGAEKIQEFNDARIKNGSFIRIAKANFSYMPPQEKGRNAWWRMKVPPFSDIARLDAKPDGIFIDISKTPATQGDAVMALGILTHLEKKVRDVYVDTGRWVEKKEEERREGVKTRQEVTYEGTITCLNGTYWPVKFQEAHGKPKIKPTDTVAVYGTWTKKGNLFVSHWETGSMDDLAIPSTAERETVSRPTRPERSQPSPAAPGPEEDEEPEEEEEEPEEEEEEEEAEEANGEEEAEEEEEEEPVVTVKPKKAAKKTAAKKPKKVVNGAVPDDIRDHVMRFVNQFGGKNRVRVVAKAAIAGEILEADDDDDAIEKMRSYIDQMVDAGELAYEDEAKNIVCAVA